MISAMVIEAPAKLNLSLRVLGRRDDGFHGIDSLMVSLPGLCDELKIELSESDVFDCSDPALPTDGSNLVIKALEGFREASDHRQSWLIQLRKRVPHGAGLGGGSSDAAKALQAFNTLAGDPLDHGELVEIAARLGSDVPFFLGSGVARATGRGEQIEEVSGIPALPVLLLKPSFGVSTPGAYKAWSESREVSGVRYKPQVARGIELVNDLERPVFEKHRFLAEAKMWLLQQAEVDAALMSGSGSTLFAVLRDPADAGGLLERVSNEVDPNLWSWSGWTAGER